MHESCCTHAAWRGAHVGVGSGPVDHEVVRLLPVGLVVPVVARVLDGVLDCTPWPGERQVCCVGARALWPRCVHVRCRQLCSPSTALSLSRRGAHQWDQWRRSWPCFVPGQGWLRRCGVAAPRTGKKQKGAGRAMRSVAAAMSHAYGFVPPYVIARRHATVGV